MVYNVNYSQFSLQRYYKICIYAKKYVPLHDFYGLEDEKLHL